MMMKHKKKIEKIIIRRFKKEHKKTTSKTDNFANTFNRSRYALVLYDHIAFVFVQSLITKIMFTYFIFS